jgi:hypothetical protein
MLRGYITPARFKEIAKLAEETLTLTARAWDVDSKLAKVRVLILQSYLVFDSVICATATLLGYRLAALLAFELILVVIYGARFLDIAVDSLVDIV